RFRSRRAGHWRRSRSTRPAAETRAPRARLAITRSKKILAIDVELRYDRALERRLVSPRSAEMPVERIQPRPQAGVRGGSAARSVDVGVDRARNPGETLGANALSPRVDKRSRAEGEDAVPHAVWQESLNRLKGALSATELGCWVQAIHPVAIRDR